jgi:hypothetical protein
MMYALMYFSCRGVHGNVVRASASSIRPGADTETVCLRIGSLRRPVPTDRRCRRGDSPRAVRRRPPPSAASEFRHDSFRIVRPCPRSSAAIVVGIVVVAVCQEHYAACSIWLPVPCRAARLSLGPTPVGVALSWLVR